MMTSNDLAKLIGPTLTLMSISEMLNLHIWRVNMPAITYLNGIILFVSGLSIIRIHNLWIFRWPVFITLLAWGALAAGLCRMFFPEAQQGGQNTPTHIVIIILFFTGVFLSYKGYIAEKNK